LTFAKMPPSTIAFLRPYFPSIRLEKLRYCLFGGEPLDRDLVAEWRQCVPHAMIQNVYGPTEATVNCLQYEVPSDPEKIKHFNGIVAIGKPFGKNRAFVAGKNRNAANPFQKGELCIAGPQVSPGYWKDEEKNREVFFELPSGRKKERWYATGDIVLTDKDGDFLFCGRSDGQVQVQGFRVELGEIEYHTRTYLRAQAVALAKENYLGTQQIHLFVEKCADPVALREFLSRKLPDYMVPSEIISVEHFPLSVSGKIDRKKLYEMI
ncbi:MAG: amino acid adenylation domain-containing protein, partial [Bacteroidales bacterium]|nr:amino acid adenylation domain-containing protein [Bacteroidales bacterium]